MGKISIYLKPKLAKKAKKAAEGASLSQSKWIAQLIEEKLKTSWPEDVKKLAGAWPTNFPEAESLPRVSPKLEKAW